MPHNEGQAAEGSDPVINKYIETINRYVQKYVPWLLALGVIILICDGLLIFFTDGRGALYRTMGLISGVVLWTMFAAMISIVGLAIASAGYLVYKVVIYSTSKDRILVLSGVVSICAPFIAVFVWNKKLPDKIINSALFYVLPTARNIFGHLAALTGRTLPILSSTSDYVWTASFFTLVLGGFALTSEGIERFTSRLALCEHHAYRGTFSGLADVSSNAGHGRQE